MCNTSEAEPGKGREGADRNLKAFGEVWGPGALPGAGWEARGAKHLGHDRFLRNAPSLPFPGPAPDLLHNLEDYVLALCYGCVPRNAPDPARRTSDSYFEDQSVPAGAY